MNSKPIFSPLTLAIRAQLFAHLAAMEKAGLPPEKAFSLLHLSPRGQTRLAATRKLLARRADIAAAGLRAGLFTPLEAALLHAATSAGSPALTYHRLAVRYALLVRQRGQLRSRCILPLLLLLAGTFIGPLPRLVAGALSFAGYLWQVARPLLQICFAVAAVIGVDAWLNTGADSPAWTMVQRWRLGLPLVGAIIVRRSLRDFFESLALLLEAGMPMFDALPLAEATVTDTIVRADLATLLTMMMQGMTLADAAAQLVSADSATIASLCALASTGESSGTLPAMLIRFADTETAHLHQTFQHLADWLPRIVYFLYGGLTAYRLLTGSGVTPLVPTDL
jgi:general secretion pathway protein F